MTDTSRLDRLTLTGIQLQPRLGTSAEERSTPQLCVADVTIWGDFEAAAATDELSHALDYVRILETVFDVAHRREYNLLETLAFKIARSVLESSPAQKVGVKVRKKPAILSGRLDHVEIEVEQR